MLAALSLLEMTQPVRSSGQPAPPSFFITSYMGRCMDFGVSPQVVGNPVRIAD
jgi:hypothetical protein